jgi:hypothetical protein
MDREAADHLFKEGTLSYRDYVRVVGARFGNIWPLTYDAQGLASVFAQIDEMHLVHSRIFKDGRNRL